MRKVFIALDLSKNSEKAVNWYLNNVCCDNDHVYLFHSIEMPSVPYMGTPMEWKAAVDAKSHELEQLKMFSEKVFQFCRGEFIAEEPFFAALGEHLVKAAKQRKVHLIVIGSRGQGLIRRTVLGSVSQYVLHHASLPTIVVPPDP